MTEAATPAKPRFLAIGQDILLSPSSEDVTPESKDPTVIIIFGWMSAQLPHLHKYTEVYTKLYPHATQILVRCRPSIFWTKERSREALLAPVVEVLEALGCVAHIPKTNPSVRSEATAPRILVHAFSNGGAYMLTTLSRMLSRRPETNTSPSTINCVVLDSSPGGGGLTLALRAFTTSFRNPFIRAAVAIFISLLYGYGLVIYFLFRQKRWDILLRETLHNPRMLPWIDENTPRLYIFSKTDELVPWQQVQSHAEKSRTLGMNVQMELFEASPHVAHSKTDPSKYWGAVKTRWEDACQVDGHAD